MILANLEGPAMNALLRVPKNDQNDGKTRVQLDLSPQMMARLNRLMEVCGIETRKDLFNNALALLEWAVSEVEKGNSIASINKESKHFTELKMPALSDAAEYQSMRTSKL